MRFVVVLGFAAVLGLAVFAVEDKLDSKSESYVESVALLAIAKGNKGIADLLEGEPG